VAKVILEKVSEAKVSYVLYPFDQATTSKAMKLFKKSKKSAREKWGERKLQKCF